MTIALQKVQAATANEICAQFELSEESAALLLPGTSPGAFLAQLMEAGQHQDACRDRRKHHVDQGARDRDPRLGHTNNGNRGPYLQPCVCEH